MCASICATSHRSEIGLSCKSSFPDRPLLPSNPPVRTMVTTASAGAPSPLWHHHSSPGPAAMHGTLWALLPTSVKLSAMSETFPSEIHYKLVGLLKCISSSCLPHLPASEHTLPFFCPGLLLPLESSPPPPFLPLTNSSTSNIGSFWPWLTTPSLFSGILSLGPCFFLFTGVGISVQSCPLGQDPASNRSLEGRGSR